MIRRQVVTGLAVLALGLAVAAPAEAGGTSGAVGVKKNATVRITNGTKDKLYVLVVPSSLAESTKFGTSGTVGWAKKLGAVLVNPGSSVSYPVPAGPGGIVWFKAESIKGVKDSTPLPEPQGDMEYTVKKGQTVRKTIAPPG